MPQTKVLWTCQTIFSTSLQFTLRSLLEPQWINSTSILTKILQFRGRLFLIWISKAWGIEIQRRTALWSLQILKGIIHHTAQKVHLSQGNIRCSKCLIPCPIFQIPPWLLSKDQLWYLGQNFLIKNLLKQSLSSKYSEHYLRYLSLEKNEGLSLMIKKLVRSNKSGILS